MKFFTKFKMQISVGKKSERNKEYLWKDVLAIDCILNNLESALLI
jgi:hypothetical protein